MRRFDAMLRAAPEQPPNMRLTGLRGVGKTVLLKEFENQAAAAEWTTLTLELQARHNVESNLLEAVRGLADSAKHQLSRLERVRAAAGRAVRAAGQLGVTWGQLTLTFDPSDDDVSEDVTRVLFELVDAAVEKGKHGVLLLLDEAQVLRDERDRRGEHPLSLLISAVVLLQRQELPVGLVVCGLPTLTTNLLRARSYTERMFRGEQVDSLDQVAAREAFVEPLRDTGVSADDGLVAEVTDEVEGYPYFIQLWGAELWDAVHDAGSSTFTPALLQTITPDIYRRLDNDFYEPRVSTLTPAEQDLLLATAGCPGYPPLVVSEINATSEKSPGNINVLLGRLVEAGVIYRLRKGQYDYTAPKFRTYLERHAARG